MACRLNDHFSQSQSDHNCAHYLPDAIGSILRQGIDYFELRIVDNASEDNTEEVIGSFGNDRIRYMRIHRTLGRVKMEADVCQRTGQVCKVSLRRRRAP